MKRILTSFGAIFLALSVHALVPWGGAGHRAPRPAGNLVSDTEGSLDPLDPIERGLSYLRANRSDASALIVLDYLQRKYGLPPDLAFDRTCAGPIEGEKRRFWGGFLGRGQAIDDGFRTALPALPPTDQLVLRALYCDRVQLPSGYGALVGTFIARGGYDLTHASLALKLVHDNGCPLDPAEDRDVGERLRSRLLRLVDAAPVDPRYEELDVRYEALAFLEDFMKERALVGERFVRLVSEQQEDGGWKPQPDRPSEPHPTVLAVWALLARAHPDAPELHFARR